MLRSRLGPPQVQDAARTGHHDYGTTGASGYFGEAAGDPSKGYYSYDLGGWHVVAVNSACEQVGGCGPDSPMVTWLKRDLAANPARCTVAYWHHPLFSSGEHGNETRMRTVWSALYRANADVVVNGHDHDYERFAPQSPGGKLDRSRGIREFVVGTGGRELRPFDGVRPNSRARSAKAFGVLKLTLGARLQQEVRTRCRREFHRLRHRPLPLRARGNARSWRSVPVPRTSLCLGSTLPGVPAPPRAELERASGRAGGAVPVGYSPG